jgi:hypothetical protein
MHKRKGVDEMKAIRVKYLACTDHRPSRWKASDECGNQVTKSYDYGVTSQEQTLRVAQALCEKMQWPTELIGGSYGDSDWYVFRKQL